jgi:hypothetical protein
MTPLRFLIDWVCFPVGLVRVGSVAGVQVYLFLFFSFRPRWCSLVCWVEPLVWVPCSYFVPSSFYPLCLS